MACHNPAGSRIGRLSPPSGERHDAASQNHALKVPDFHATRPCLAPFGRNTCKIAILQSCVNKGETTFLPLCAEKLHGRSFSELP